MQALVTDDGDVVIRTKRVQKLIDSAAERGSTGLGWAGLSPSVSARPQPLAQESFVSVK